MKKLLSVGLVCVFLMTAALFGVSMKKRQKYVDSHPMSLVVRYAILHEEAAVGETIDEILATFGRPNAINRTATGAGVQVQWVFYITHLMSNKADRTVYVYFENDVVTAWQDG